MTSSKSRRWCASDTPEICWRQLQSPHVHRAHELLSCGCFVQPISMAATDGKSNFLAAATVSHMILLFSWQPAKQRFSFAGSCKSASAPVSICFGEDPGGQDTAAIHWCRSVFSCEMCAHTAVKLTGLRLSGLL